MENTEFYTTPSGDVMIESEDGPAKLLKEDGKRNLCYTL